MNFMEVFDTPHRLHKAKFTFCGNTLCELMSMRFSRRACDEVFVLLVSKTRGIIFIFQIILPSCHTEVLNDSACVKWLKVGIFHTLIV